MLRLLIPKLLRRLHSVLCPRARSRWYWEEQFRLQRERDMVEHQRTVTARVEEWRARDRVN
jgi:hypothetical protein